MAELDPQARFPETSTTQEIPHPTRRGVFVVAGVAGAILGVVVGYAFSVAAGLPPETAAMVTTGGGLEGAIAIPVLIADR